MEPPCESDNNVIDLTGIAVETPEGGRTEDSLRESEEHFRFLNALAEATRTLADPEQIMVVMSRMLGEHLRASRCAYADVEKDGEQFTILHDYTDGCVSTVGNYQLSLFGARAVARLHSGQTLIIRNVEKELLPDDGADMFNAIGIKAIITCPLVKEGRLRAMMAVHQATPRDWKPREVALTREVVERCWTTIERRTVEEKLCQSEALLRLAGRIAKLGGWVVDLLEVRVTWSDEVCAILELPPGTVPGLEQAFSLYVPPSRETVRKAFADCAEHGTPFDLELEVITAKGRCVWVRSIGEAQRNAAGAITRVQGAFQDVTERKEAARIQDMHQRLVDASRQAGMAEIATNVLHNVGNALNSVNVSSTILADGVRKSRGTGLGRVVKLLQEHEADLGAFLTNDSKGRQIPNFLAQLASHLAGEQAVALKELGELQKNIERIKEIVAMQQNYAKVSSQTEIVMVPELIDDALKINSSELIRHDIEVIKEFKPVPPLLIEKHKVLNILVNLIRNAEQACAAASPAAGRLTMRLASGDGSVTIAITDNGVGIPAENLERIFNHGFTTRKDGHGFSLHSSSLAAKAMGGALSVHSGGTGLGATFTVELPLNPPGGGVTPVSLANRLEA